MKVILKKPIITEKTNMLSEKRNKFTFEVEPTANKLQIKDAVEEMYNVDVLAVNTLIRPRKERSRFTKAGLLKGKTKLVKKAVVTVADGETIDFYTDI